MRVKCKGECDDDIRGRVDGDDDEEEVKSEEKKITWI